MTWMDGMDGLVRTDMQRQRARERERAEGVMLGTGGGKGGRGRAVLVHRILVRGEVGEESFVAV